MKRPADFPKVYITWRKVDFRKWIDGLCAVVQHEIKQGPTDRTLFVFISRCRGKMKALYWDETGFAIWYKRLESGKFKVPRKGESSITVSPREFEMFLDGYDVVKQKPHRKIFDIRIS